MYELPVFKEFFSEIEKLNLKNDLLRKDRLEKGDLFNVFTAVGLWSEEVRLHSAFLASLLNPAGSHGQKDKFLKLFLSCTNMDCASFDTLNAKVYIEYSIGNISEDRKSGGRIDILIVFPDSYKIVIENKIYAGDQPFQLIRYKNFIDGKGIIFYLTLDGHKPSEYSKGKEENFYSCISYRNEIAKWLEECALSVSDMAYINSSILQYLDLIKLLTGDTMDETLNSEIDDFLLDENKKYVGCLDSIIASAERLNKKIAIKMLDDFCNSLPEQKFSYEKTDYIGVYIKSKNQPLTFILDYYNYHSWWIGVKSEDSLIAEKIRKIPKGFSNHDEWQWWDWIKPLCSPGYSKLDELRRNSSEKFLAVINQAFRDLESDLYACGAICVSNGQ